VAVGIAIVGGTYLAIAVATGHAGSTTGFWTWLLGYGTQAKYWSPLGPKAVLLAGVGLGRAVIGGHFVFAIPALQERMEILFPGNSLDDEAYLVRGYAGGAAETLLGLSVLWIIAAAACLALAVAGAAHLVRHSRWAPLLPLLAWLVPYALFFTAWDATNVDFWVPQVLLGWMLLAIGLVAGYAARQAASVLAALATGLLVLNGLGSIVPARDPRNDYYRTKVESGSDGAEWPARHRGPLARRPAPSAPRWCYQVRCACRSLPDGTIGGGLDDRAAPESGGWAASLSMARRADG
jgi:hypothetical protein